MPQDIDRSNRLICKSNTGINEVKVCMDKMRMHPVFPGR
jgi:hypothetical protein